MAHKGIGKRVSRAAKATRGQKGTGVRTGNKPFGKTVRRHAKAKR